MSVRRLSNDRIFGILFIIILIILSLLSSYFLFRVLDSIAEIKSKSISLGGAIAGFFIIYKLLEKSYYKLFANESKLLVDIENLQKENKELLVKLGQIININIDCPKDFKTEISTDLKFGFAYPNNWNFLKSQIIDYGFIVPKKSGKDLTANANIVYYDTTNSEVDLNELVELQIKDELLETPNSKLLSDSDNLIINGSTLRRIIISWIDKNKTDYIAYLNYIIDNLGHRIVKVTFTCKNSEFSLNRNHFDNIINTFKITLHNSL